MSIGSLFPGMPDTIGAVLPALISIVLILTGFVRSGLRTIDQVWLVGLSLALSIVLTRSTITPEETSLHIIPGALVLICYLVWRGHYISPGYAFVLTYVTSLPVDFVMARTLFGPEFNSEFIGGGGWYDGLLILPTLTALAVIYANWRAAMHRTDSIDNNC